jgi:hypothetical protein
MPRRKEVKFVADEFENGYGQVIQVGDPVMFIGSSFGVTKHDMGTYSGKYVLTDKVVSVKVDIKKTFWDRRLYSILPLSRVFKLQLS